jgi:formylglycine-generating enzyme required for sulfatase activity
VRLRAEGLAVMMALDEYLQQLRAGTLSLARFKARLSGELAGGVRQIDALESWLADAFERQRISASEHSELRAVLAAHLKAGPAERTLLRTAFSTGPAAAEPPELRSDGSTSTDESAAGQVLSGRYRLGNALGAGGMGIVYRAEDQVGGETVAVKLLRPEFQRNALVIGALRDEVIKTRKLRHENILGVYALEQHGAQPYVVMEYLEGATLQRLLDEEGGAGLPPARAWPILRGAAAGLSFAHHTGIIHSDIKPSNIFVTLSGRIKVLDFGIARALRQSAKSFDTASLNAVTAAYATQEMLDGEPPTESDDVFGLACVAYELLTGRHPFKGLDSKAAKAQNVTPAPVRSLSKLQNGALLRGLAFDRGSRTPTVHDFIEQLTGSSAPSRRRWAIPALIVVAGSAGLAWALYTWLGTARSPHPGESLRDCDQNCPRMVVLPAGRFQMGSPDSEAGRSTDERQRTVYFPKPFALSVYPITRREFKAFIDATGWRPSAGCIDSSHVPGVKAVDYMQPGFAQSDDDPVVCISFDDARAYADWIGKMSHHPGYRVATEAEWEYAARAGTQSTYPWGSSEADACTHGNFGDASFQRSLMGARIASDLCDDRFAFTSPVHAFPPNAWGLSDVLGNVREWTEGCSHPGNGALDGSRWLEGCHRYAVMRGAGFATRLGSSYVRIARRTPAPRNVQAVNELGFRLARSL